MWGKWAESLTGHLLVEWDHRSAEWIPNQSPAAADWWLYLQLAQMVKALTYVLFA